MQLLCRQEIDIETWAGPTIEASRVVTRPICQFAIGRGAHYSTAIKRVPALYILSQWREWHVSYAWKTVVLR